MYDSATQSMKWSDGRLMPGNSSWWIGTSGQYPDIISAPCTDLHSSGFLGYSCTYTAYYICEVSFYFNKF